MIQRSITETWGKVYHDLLFIQVNHLSVHLCSLNLNHFDFQSFFHQLFILKLFLLKICVCRQFLFSQPSLPVCLNNFIFDCYLIFYIWYWKCICLQIIFNLQNKYHFHKLWNIKLNLSSVKNLGISFVEVVKVCHHKI